jgi:16S rRNA C967 or C1407 C5-methylase (RsmB/RsmF family)
MYKPFREHHLLRLLSLYDQKNLPLDLVISDYFKANSALGSKDRGEIAETLYGMFRWLGLIDHLCKEPLSWEKRLECYRTLVPEEYQDQREIEPHIRCSCSKPLFEAIQASYNEENAFSICLANNTPAPTTVRINPLKTTRESMLERWRPLYDVSPCTTSSLGIVFHKRMNFFTLPEFKEGLFEVQDEGSQRIGDLVQAQPGDLIMDYCSGSGGKTLAFAHKTGNSGQIYLHDIRKAVLLEAKKRLKRAGIQNAQTIAPDSPTLNKLKKKMDWVLVDVPCSGTGTLRRNPDMKWKFSEEMLTRLIGQQRVIFEKALSFLSLKGSIVYATCSVLRQENETQIDHFVRVYQLERVGEPLKTLPTVGGPDGFFGQVLRRKGEEAMIHP